MLERIMLAAIVTFCIYLFLQLSGKPSKSAFFDDHIGKVPKFVSELPVFSP